MSLDREGKRILDSDSGYLRALAATIASAETTGDVKFFEDLLHERFVMRRANGNFTDRRDFLSKVSRSAERQVRVNSIAILGKHRATMDYVVTMPVEGAVANFQNFLLFVREATEPWKLLCWANERSE